MKRGIELIAFLMMAVLALVIAMKVKTGAETPDMMKTVYDAPYIAEPIQQKTKRTYLDVALTAYCPCEQCCGIWAGGPTFTGVMPKEQHTIAVDPNVIPLGTMVNIRGEWYKAEDTGAFSGNVVDIYFDSHEKAACFGLQYDTVYWEESR